jgi:hypothetical protein
MSRAVILVAVTAVLAIAPFASAASSPSFKVTSTLDGKAVLPHRIHWIATFHIPSAQVTNYSFQIDGKTRWSGGRLPAIYADGNGFLVTSWLSPENTPSSFVPTPKAVRQAPRQ